MVARLAVAVAAIGLIAPVVVAAFSTKKAPVADAHSVGALTAADTAAIERVCRDMLEAWYGGDAEKMAGALHHDLAKRGVIVDPESGVTTLRFANKDQMVEGARSGRGRIPRDTWNIHVTILDASRNMATVKVLSEYLLDICQVARIDGRWQIVNVLWEPTKTPPWF